MATGNPYHIRTSFEEAIGEKLLFKKSWDRLNVPQQMTLKSIYGVPLTNEEKRYWDAFNGFGEYDELGYLTGTSGTFDYHPKDAEDVTLIFGRRSTKTSNISSFIAAYEAICGGHKAFVGEKQDPVILQVAQDLMTAKGNLRQFIIEHLERSPIGKIELGNMRETVTADQIRLGGALITVGPPTIKLRGQAVAVFLADELAFWPKDKEAASPDFEVERAVVPSMGQFPFRKRVKTSTPWTEEGLLWMAYNTGTYGHKLEDSDAKKKECSGVIVMRAPTASIAPESVAPRSFLRQENSKDHNAFRREYLAEFQKSVSGFLNPTLIRGSVTSGVLQREPIAGQLHIATLDPAFRRDAFALCIGHMDEKGNHILDYAGMWRGTPAQPLSPSTALASCANICRRYGISLAVSDQWHSESLQELGLLNGLVIEACPLTQQLKKTMWGDVISLLHQTDGQQGTKLKLLNHVELIEELLGMEQVLTPMGTVQYRGKRDDLAMAYALNVHRCVQFGVRTPAAPDTIPDEWVIGRENAYGPGMSFKQEMRDIRQRTESKLDRSRTPNWWVNR